MALLEYTPRQTCFQYTTIDGFRGIINSKNIWLNDLTKSNDPRDIVLGIDTIRDIVMDVRNTEYEGYIGFPISLIMAQAERYYEKNRLFTACFTPERDNINMWREYAGRGSGVSIGFRPRALLDIHGRIYQVRYVQDDVVASLRKMIVELFAPLLADPDQHLLGDPETNVTRGVKLISMINSIKHRSWAYEREMRLTFASSEPPEGWRIPVSEFPDGTELEFVPPLTRLRGNETLEYYSHPFGKFNRGNFDARRAIEHIVIGPHCILTEADIRQEMHEAGYQGFRIERSECQFRP